MSSKLIAKEKVANKNLYYMFYKGKLWWNMHNMATIMRESGTQGLNYIWTKLPKNSKLLYKHHDFSRGSMYLLDKEFERVQNYASKEAYRISGFEKIKQTREEIKDIHNMNKYLNTLTFTDINETKCKQRWFQDKNKEVWYDSVDLLTNLGFTDKGFTVEEELGKLYLEQNEPKKLRTGRVHWNSKGLSSLKEIIDDNTRKTQWDNVDIICTLIKQEIEESVAEFKELLNSKCYMVADLNKAQLKYLTIKGWTTSKTKVVVPLYKTGTVIYDKSLLNLAGCKKELKTVTSFEYKLEALLCAVDKVIGDRTTIDAMSIQHNFTDKQLHFVYNYLKEKGYVKDNETKAWCLEEHKEEVVPTGEVPKQVLNEDNTVNKKQVQEIQSVEFLPLPTKTVRYKELVESKGWWIFKSETWETKTIEVNEEEVDTFVSSLENNCEIIEIK